jgi:hypothetical protein
VADLSIKGNWFSILKKKNLTNKQKNMVEWNKADWQPLTTQGGRYAPKEVKDSLTDDQRAYESRKKREGTKKGKQHVPRGKTAKKVYQRVEGRSRGRGFTRRD